MAKKTTKTKTPTTTHKMPVANLPLPNVLVITRKAAHILWKYRLLFAGITLIYGLLNVFFAQALSGGVDVANIKNNLEQSTDGKIGQFGVGFGAFVYVLGTAGNNASSAASAFQLLLMLICSLAVIWSLRQVYTGASSSIRDAFYRGMYPLVPFILVLMVITLQLLPLLAGSTLYSIVVSNGIAVNLIEQLIFGVIYVVLAGFTVYWLTASVIALYVVTLPEMTPIKAVRSARELVKGRRWLVLRKMLFLPVLLVIIEAVILIPIIIVYAPAAKYVYFILTMFGLVAIHSYIYALYRELLNE